MPRLAIALTSGLLLVAVQYAPSSATASTAETLEALCHKELQLGDSGCTCVGERGEAELNEQELALVVAMINNDQTEIGKLQSELPMKQFMGAANFTVKPVPSCTSQ